MRNQIERDLSKDLQHRVGEVMERQIKLARQVLEPADIAIMLVQLSVMVNLSSAATVAANAADVEGVAGAFDTMLSSIATFTASDRERSLAAIKEARPA